MSRLKDFVSAAGNVAAVQEAIINALEDAVETEEYAGLEAVILAPGYEGWEARALKMLKTATQEKWEGLNADIGRIATHYKKPVAYPGQSQEFCVDPIKQPHLRVYWCLKCGFRVTSMALSGICCFGQPDCPRCHHQVHEANCRRKTAAPAPEQA